MQQQMGDQGDQGDDGDYEDDSGNDSDEDNDEGNDSNSQPKFSYSNYLNGEDTEKSESKLIVTIDE